MKAKAALSLASLLLAWQLPALAAPETYAIANDHSFANWQIRHVASRVSGTFSDVTGTLVIDRSNLAASRVDARIKMISLNSSHRERDLHTLSSQYLDGLKFPEMSFVSTAVKPTGPDAGTIRGKFTLHGVTREIEFPFRILGFAPDPWGGFRTGVQGHTSIRLSDYGYGFGSDDPAKSPLGNEVDITLLIEGIKLGPDGKPLMGRPPAK